jgi:hypothetical protein
VDEDEGTITPEFQSCANGSGRATRWQPFL